MRFIMALLAAFAGFFGLAIGLILLITHMCSLNNYNTAYMSPFVDVEERNIKDTIFRFPINYFKKRPKDIAPYNQTKQGEVKKG
jgi:spore germination protein KA